MQLAKPGQLSLKRLEPMHTRDLRRAHVAILTHSSQLYVKLCTDYTSIEWTFAPQCHLQRALTLPALGLLVDPPVVLGEHRKSH
jgi:hypothetical protein